MIILGIDPGQEASALWTWDLEKGPLAAEVVRLARAGHTQVDSIATIRRLVGDAEWVAALEKPPPPKQGLRAAPSAAFQHWKDVLDLFAREQQAAAGKKRFRKPDVRYPLPHEWRKPLGIPTRGGREFLKAKAQEYVRRVLAPKFPVLVRDLTDDEAESACIASWLATAVEWERRVAAGAEHWGVPAELRPKKLFAKPTRRPRRTRGAA